MNILIISPHGDDEVLGCGGTIKKHTLNGDDVYLCIVTVPTLPKWDSKYIANRKNEISSSSKILGIKAHMELGYNTTELDNYSASDIIDNLVKVKNDTHPDIVYIPFYGDLHQDHRTLFNMCMIAFKDINKIISYETLSETELGINSFKPNLYVDIKSTMKYKLEAMKCYKSELKEYPHCRSIKGIENLAMKRGNEVGLEYAESFILIRETL